MEDIEAQVHSVTGDQPASTTANPQGPQGPHPAVVAAAQPTATNVNPQTRNPTPPNTADPQPRATSANGHPHGEAPPSPIAGGNPDPQQDEKFGDSSDGLWSMYLTEAEKQDKDVTESWKGDAEGILVFTGLFSATVATFIIESYQNLSPKSSDTTNALLTQISQQLVNISNGTPLTSVAAQISQPFKPTASAVRVNVLWFLSLVLSVTCALSATLMQQWARRYQELAQHHGAPHKRGRMRAYIFDGISRFGMARAVATMPKLLHISVFLFFAGLIDFLFPIDTTVSYLTLGLVVAFTLAYAVLTVLPNLYLDCPYATPLSGFTWRLSQFSVIVGLKAALGIEDLFHNSLLSGQVDQHVTRPRVERWREALENQVKVHRQWLSDGLRRSVERNAKDTPPTAVTNALEWTLTGLDEDKEIETFAAGVPGFFDSRTVPNATSAILPLMTEKTPTDAILGSRLYDLLKTCMPGTSPLNDDGRKSRLRLCLKSLWYFGRAYNQSRVSEPLPSYFPRTLASPEIIRLIQTEQDLVSRVMGRCFGALVVVKLAADVRSRTGSSVQINHEELACLSAILDAESRDVIFCLKWPGAVELASMISLALGGVGSSGISALPSDVLDAAQQTLTILSQTAEQLLDQPVGQLNISDGKFDRIIISRLHSLLKMCISGTSPLSAEVRRSCLRMCLKNLCYFGRAYNQPRVPEPLPSYLIRTLASPEIIRRIRTEQDPISRVMGRCFCNLVVVKLAGGVRLRADPNVQTTDEELACLSAILGTKSDDVRLCLKWSGAVELASMVSLLAFDDVDTWAVNTLPSDVHDVTQQTLAILSQVLPTEETTGLRLDLPITGLDISDGKFGRIIVSHLFNLLEVYILGTSPLTAEVRRSCLRLCLKSLWYFGREYNQPRASEPLPSYFPRTFSSPEISRLIQTEQDPVSRVMVCCSGALVVKKLVAGIKSSTDLNAQVSDEELACLSAILRTESDDVKLWLRQPGSIELVNTLFLAFGDIGFLSADTVPSYVLDVVPQTFSILSQVLPAEINTKPGPDRKHALADIPDAPIKGEIHQGHSIGCLKDLWRCVRAYNQPGNSVPLPPYVLTAFASPAMSRRIRMERDVSTRVIGRCIEALVVKKLVAGVKSSTDSNVQIGDEELACLSVILGTKRDDVKLCLQRPGAIELASVVSLALGDLGSLVINALPSDVLDVTQQTVAILSQALPAGETAGLQLVTVDLSIARPNISDGKFDHVIVSHLHNLLQMCTSGTSPLTAEVRRSCLRMCLRNLWYCAKAYNQLGASKQLPSYFTHALASPEIIRLIQAEKDPVAHVMGRCFGALIINNLVAYIKSRTDSNAQINDKVLGCLSAILGTESRDLKLWLRQPSAIELTNAVFLAFGDIGSLAADTVPPYVLDAIPQTFSILSQALPVEINTEPEFNQIRVLADMPDGAAPIIGEVYQNHSIRCLKNLWRCVRAYNQPGNSAPLPPYILTAFVSSSMSRRIRTERDAAARVIGRCVEAMVLKKLVTGARSSTDSDVQISDEELACLSTILGTKRDGVKHCLKWPGAVELAGMVSLALGDVGSLANALPPDVLDVTQQTLAILSQALPTEEMAELQLDLPIAGLNISDGKFDRVIVSHLHNLLQMCTSGTSPLTAEVRRSCLRMFLKSLWYCAKAHHRPGASQHLPSYFPRTLAGPEIIRLIQTEQDPVSRVTVCYFGALVVKKLAVGVRSRTDSSVQIIDEELACLSSILGTESDDVKLCLQWPNAIELTSMVSLALGDVGSLAADALPSDVLDMAQQTLAILSQVLPAEETAELQLHLPIARLNILDGKFGRMIASRLLNLLQMCKSDTSPLTAEVRRSCLRMCLKSLWYCAKAYHQLGASERLPSYFPHTLASPEVIHLIQAEQDPVSRVIGRCFEALVLKKLLGGVKTSTNSDIQIGDEELACLSAILGTKRGDVRLCLEWPGAVELANMVSLSLGDVGSLDVNALPPNAFDVAQQTLAILSQVLLAEETVELHLDLPITRLNISEGKFDRVIVSHLHNVLQMCISGTSPLTTEVRRSCLRVCLKSLWYCAKAYNQFGASEWLPSYFTLAIACPEIIRLIQAEKDPVAHVMGRCFGALIVNNLVTYVKSHSDSNAQSGDEVLGYLSAILGTESRDFRLSLGRAGTVELANMLSLIFSEIDSSLPDTAPSDVLDMIQQTYRILSRTLLTELNDKLMIFPDGALPLTEPLYESRSCICLKNLWRCATAYNQLGISMPLPSFVRISLASLEITRRIHTEKDLTARVTGRCACALIVNKLVDDFQSRISFGDGVYDADLACISSILSTEPDEFLRWPHHSTAIKLLNVISLMSGEIEALFIWEETPADVLRVMQQTLNIICSELVLGGAFASGDLPMDQVSLLRDICSRITNAQPADRFRDQTVELLDQLQQISKQLPLVECKMRRCASSIFDPQLVRERGNLTTRPEYEARRRRSKSM